MIEQEQENLKMKLLEDSKNFKSSQRWLQKRNKAINEASRMGCVLENYEVYRIHKTEELFSIFWIAFFAMLCIGILYFFAGVSYAISLGVHP